MVQLREMYFPTPIFPRKQALYQRVQSRKEKGAEHI